MKKSLVLLGMLCLTSTLNAQKLTEKNVKEIVKAMTLEEKAKMVIGCSASAFTGYGNSTLYVPGSAASTAMIERLGIPPTVLADGPAGLRISPTREGTDQTYYCTAFPIGTALACSWNSELVENVGATIGNEVLEYGVDVLLAPGQNLHRDPLCGRNFEYYSEDPILSGKMAAAYVRGVQSQGVGTSVKHFAVNNAETNRKDNDSRLDQRPLRELYLKGFEIAVKESNPWTVMTAYNAINGQQSMESRELLTDILRNEWGFDGYVMCDWAYAGLRKTDVELWAGNDLLTPGSDQQYEEVLAAVKSGKLKESDLDLNVERILGIVVKSPRFHGYKYSDKPDLKAHAEVARQAATECIVLLENKNNTLPLKNTGKNVGLFGISSYDFIAGGTGSGSVNKAYTINLLDGFKNDGYTVNSELAAFYQDAIKKQLEVASLTNPYAAYLGRTALPEVSINAKMIEQSAQQDDLAVVTIGRSNGEGLDRHAFEDYLLKSVEKNLLMQVSNAFHKQGKKVIVILNISGATELEPLKEMADAVVCCWLPGQEGGNTVMDVLSGRQNPSGKLSMSIPVNYFDANTHDNFAYDYTGPSAMGKYAMTPYPKRKNVHFTEYEEGIYVGYRYYNTNNVKLSYPFGYGLSYTTFSYSNPTVKAEKDGFTATITVKNTGNVTGKEAVQLYVSAPAGGLDKPKCELKSFGKTKELKPGESQTLTFKVDSYSLASFNEKASQWETASGEYKLMFAANIEDVRQTASYIHKNAQNWKVNNVLKRVE